MSGLHTRLAAAALTSASVLALSAPAYAQVHNWTGFYIGANAGAAFGGSDASSNVPCTATASPPGYFCTTAAPQNGLAVGASGTGSLSSTGFSGGGQAGYNLQILQYVFGVEIDYGAFRVNASRQGSANYPSGAGMVATTNTYTVGSTVEANQLLTARARVGYAFGNLLAYATGGMAMTTLHVTNFFRDNNPGGGFPGATEFASGSARKIGFAAGGGLEWALSKNWTLRTEYLYVHFGSVTVTGTILHPGLAGYSQALSTSSDLTAHIARLGINFQF